MDRFKYRELGETAGNTPRLRIGALNSVWDWRSGEGALMPRDAVYWRRNPFDSREVKGVSGDLLMDTVGSLSGHNVMVDSTIMDGLKVDKTVPVSPLFARDLCGRVIYLGYGPELKRNEDWAAYMPPPAADGTFDPNDVNPFVPLITFPTNCRDVGGMEGADLLERVFLTKFRCLEMGFTREVLPSGGNEDEMVTLVYGNANLYPYKLRLDTFYIDGWKLPQTQMVFAKRENVRPESARKAGEEEIMNAWREREPGTKYEDWLKAKGGAEQVELWYQRGCTLIPTFEGCNGLNVVDENFGLVDFWPGRAVEGLHEIVERRPGSAPAGTIIHVVAPGYVTANHVQPAQVMVSDGSGYVSAHLHGKLPMLPNMHLPHQRTIADWQSVWLPTEPQHFEMPAIWGWDLDHGRFLQLHGPLWDPLHYYYASVDEVLKAYENPLSLEENRWLTAVPEHMRNRFYPIVAMKGFDTLSELEYTRRWSGDILPRSCIKRVGSEESAGVGYHPLPIEFEFELDTFWFPQLNPLNRSHGDCPEGLLPLVVPVITPKVAPEAYLDSLEVAGDEAAWIADPTRLRPPEQDVFGNYPQLARYLLPELDVVQILQLCPLPFLGELGDLLGKPAEMWWPGLDSKTALDNLQPGIHATVWDARQRGVEVIKFRHLVYQSYEQLYMLAYWCGATVPMLEEMVMDWIENEKVRDQGGEAQSQLVQQQGAVEKMREVQPERGIAPMALGLPEENL